MSERVARLTVGDWSSEILERCLIGRDPACDVCLPDPMVGRRHAEVTRTPDGRYQLRDLGSRHGVYVGGRRISEAYLSHGDEILVGVYRLRFEDERQHASSQPVLLPATAAAPTPQCAVPVSEPTFPPASEYGDDVESLKRNYERLRAAFELSHSVGIEPDLGPLLERILGTAFQLLGTDRGAILLRDPETGRVTHQVSRTRNGDRSPLALSQTIVEQVINGKKAVISSDTSADTRFHRSRSICAQGIRSAMCVPLMYRDELLGLMHLDSHIANSVFGEADLELFTSVATQAAMAVKNATLSARMRQAAVWERLERVVDSLPEGVLVLDAERRVVLANRPMEALLHRLTNAQRGEVLDTLGEVSVQELLEGSGEPEREVVLDGARPQTLRISGFQVGGGGAESGEYLIAVRDVTEERDRDVRSRQQDRLALLGQLASGVAHDFNNLLTVILNYAEILESRISDPGLQEDFEQLRQAGMRASGLTRQLLAFSRRQPLRTQNVELNEMLGGLERLLELSVGRRVLLEVRRHNGALVIEADPTQLEQVLINLAVNARDAMPDGGVLRVETTAVTLSDEEARRSHGLPGGTYARLNVTDTGCGMTPEIAARIFEPFFTTKDPGRGTGLGLAMVLGIVTRLEGAIGVDSTPGKGTSFSLLLPMRGAGVGTTPVHARKVLVVDDDAQVRRSVARLLAHQGFAVLEAENGERALEVYAANRRDLALLVADVILPGMSGLDLSAEMGRLGARLPVLYISAKVDGAIAQGDMGVGSAFLAKPFTEQDLRQVVARLLPPLPGVEAPPSQAETPPVTVSS